MTKIFFGFCAIVFAGAILQAQQQADSLRLQSLDEVVVSDSRFPLKREYSGKTVISIDSVELEKNQGRSLAELINTKSGMEISGSRGRTGEVLGVYARGGRGRQVLVLIDGVRISDPSSSSQEYDLRLMDMSAIASIEIIKGATSTLYGTNAATAVISIITKKGSPGKIGGQFHSSHGSHQTQADQQYAVGSFVNNARVAGTLEHFTYALVLGHTFSNGLSSLITPANEIDPFSRLHTELRIGYRFSDQFQIDIHGNQVRMKTEYDESFAMVDAPYRYTSKQERAGTSAIFSYAPGEVHFNMAYTRFNSENISAFPGNFTGSNYVLDVFNSYEFDEQFYTILGLNHSRDEAHFSTTTDFQITDPYANVVYVSPFGLNLNTGARLNLHSEYGSHLVYSINPSFTLKNEHGYLKLIASYATAYITPSLVQLFGEFGANAALQPEDDRTIEVGIEVTESSKIRSSLLYFNRKEADFVYFDSASSQYQNALNTIDAHGIEGEISWLLTEKLRLEANYTFTERKGDNAIRIPKHKVNSELAYTFSDKTYASLNYALTGERRDTDFTTFTEVTLQAYSLLGAYFSQVILPNRLKVYLDGFNLLNTSYTEVLGFSSRGRNISLGMRLSF